MELMYQKAAIEQLQKIADSDKHSILIQGVRGCGKSYLAKVFADMKSIPTFHTISPKVNDLKTVIDDSYRLQDLQVLCIENLDDGVNAASQVILKYLEEPLPNVYIIVTCVNDSKLPDTIISRAITVHVNVPFKDDLLAYAAFFDRRKAEICQSYQVLETCKSLTDVKQILSLNVDQLQYYDELAGEHIWTGSVDQITWALGHFEDNAKTDLRTVLLVLRNANLITNKALAARVKSAALSALLSLESSRLSETAILGKLVLDVKVG